MTAGRFEPELVIFDCDGVLVDSEPISIAVLLDTINGAGGAIDEETAYALFLGKSMATIVEILRADFGLSITSEHLALMRAELFRRFRQELKAIRGVREALAGIGLRRCVASSGQPERIRLALGVTGLLELFEPHIYSATMVDRGKPAPDLFLHAAAEMRASPDRCLVIEDSPAGVTAAQAAGMTVFAFHGGSHGANVDLKAALDALAPDRLFDDMADLPTILAGRDAWRQAR